MSCSDVSESYSVCYLFTDSSTTSMLNLTKKGLLTKDKVSVNTSPVNNSSVMRKLFRKRLIFSSDSCSNLLLDKLVLSAMPTAREKCASHNEFLLMFSKTRNESAVPFKWKVTPCYCFKLKTKL